MTCHCSASGGSRTSTNCVVDSHMFGDRCCDECIDGCQSFIRFGNAFLHLLRDERKNFDDIRVTGCGGYGAMKCEVGVYLEMLPCGTFLYLLKRVFQILHCRGYPTLS